VYFIKAHLNQTPIIVIIAHTLNVTLILYSKANTVKKFIRIKDIRKTRTQEFTTISSTIYISATVSLMEVKFIIAKETEVVDKAKRPRIIHLYGVGLKTSLFFLKSSW